jgi:hypothetical protein
LRFQSAVRKFTWLQTGLRLFAAAEPVAPVAPGTAPCAPGTASGSPWSRFRHTPAFGGRFRQRPSPPSVPPSPPESRFRQRPSPPSVPPSPPESALNDAPECPPSPLASMLGHWISEAGSAITQSFKHPGAPFASHARAQYGASFKQPAAMPGAMLGATDSAAAPASSIACGRTGGSLSLRSVSAVSGSVRELFGIDAQHGAVSRRLHEVQYDEDDEGEGGHLFTSHYPSAAHHVVEGRHVFVPPKKAIPWSESLSDVTYLPSIRFKEPLPMDHGRSPFEIASTPEARIKSLYRDPSVL